MPDLFLSTEEIQIECPELYGIATPMKAYKMAWQIQQSKEYRIQKVEEVINYNDGGEHICYELHNLDSQAVLLMCRNKGSKGMLYKKYKHIDFILLSIAPDLSIDNKSLTLFKELDGVTLCTNLESPSKPDNMNFVQLL